MRAVGHVALTAGFVADHTPSTKELLKRAAAYVSQQAELLPQLVAEERSSQTLRPRVQHLIDPPPRVIESRADFAWIRLEGMPEAIGVRDVREVDGRPVGGPERLEELLRRPTTSSIAAARALLAESARYNVGPLWRNVNLPTTALFLLHDSLQPRFSWKVEGTGESGAVCTFLQGTRAAYRDPRFERRACLQPRTHLD